MRYVNHAIPTLLIGFGLFLNGLEMILKRRKLAIVFVGIIILFFGFYSVSSYKRLRTQVSINLKYAETPWYYISVLKLNAYFHESTLGTKKPYVISSMPPYYIDFFSNGNYRLLPLHREQEFRGAREEAWGTNDYSDLLTLYESYLKRRQTLFIHNYGLGNEEYLKNAFNQVEKRFKITLVQEGCYNACNIWRVELKDSDSNSF
jgi:hypothetical protein